MEEVRLPADTGVQLQPLVSGLVPLRPARAPGMGQMLLAVVWAAVTSDRAALEASACARLCVKGRTWHQARPAARCANAPGPHHYGAGYDV